MKITNYIQRGIITIMGIAMIVGFLNYKNLQRDAEEYRAEMLSLSQLHVTAEGLASQRALEIEKLRASNDALNSTIKKNKETIRSLLALTGTLTDSLSNISTNIDTIYVADSNIGIAIRRFNAVQGGFNLAGYFQIVPPYQINFDKMIAKIELEIAMSQNKQKIWTAYVSSPNPGFVVTDLNVKVNPYEPTFWEKLQFGIGAYASSSRVGVSSSVYYDKHSIKLMFDTQGSAVGYERILRIK